MGEAVWWTYQDVVLDDHDFPALGAAFDNTPYVRTGQVRSAYSRLMPLRQTVDFACGWLARSRTS
jgi:aminoglycoside 3-N-acetyltransferase